MKRRLAAAVIPVVLLVGPLCGRAGAAPLCTWGTLVPLNLCVGR